MVYDSNTIFVIGVWKEKKEIERKLRRKVKIICLWDFKRKKGKEKGGEFM